MESFENFGGAVSITSKFSLGDMLTAALEEIDYGVMVVDPITRRLLHANRLAQIHCQSDGSIALEQGQVHARNRSNEAELEKALTFTLADRRSLLTLEGGRRNVDLSVVSLAGPNGQRLALLLFGRDSISTLSVSSYARRHALTPAEDAVLRALARGLQPVEIALNTGVAHSTVRSQIASIRTKTRTASVHELILRMALLPPINPMPRMFSDGLEELGATRAKLERQISSMKARVAELTKSIAAQTASSAPERITGSTSPSASAKEAPSGSEEGWQELRLQGEARRVAWVNDGLLVSSAALSKHWGRSRQALDQASGRGELFSLKVGKNKYYPAAFLASDADAVKRVCLAMKGDDSTAKFLFWCREHGALGGKTLLQAIQQHQIARAEELALGWSEERGLLDASTT